MRSHGKNWAIVLAAGQGTRLAALTTFDGVATPKQFCSLPDGRTLLEHALARAGRMVPPERTVVIVAAQHRPFWKERLAHLPSENVVVQPHNRGTAAGVLLPLLSILERDREARVLLLASDHFVAEEHVLHGSLRTALRSLDRPAVTLLGITPDSPETSYGWILPENRHGALAPVGRFVEKPDAERAKGLMWQGALWNSMLLVATARGLLGLFERTLPELVLGMRRVLREEGEEGLARFYAGLESSDFSGQVLQRAERDLRVLAVPPCGWTDLGTPGRVAACVSALLRRSREGQSKAERSFDLVSALERARGAFDLAAPMQAANA